MPLRRQGAAQGQRKQQRDVHAVAGPGDGHRGLQRRHHQGRRVVLAAARSHDDLLQFWRTRWIWFPCADIGRYPFCLLAIGFPAQYANCSQRGAADSPVSATTKNSAESFDSALFFALQNLNSLSLYPNFTPDSIVPACLRKDPPLIAHAFAGNAQLFWRPICASCLTGCAQNAA